MLTCIAVQAIDVIASVRTDPCGDIRRINVEIPTLSVSDFKRLKATDKVFMPVCACMCARECVGAHACMIVWEWLHNCTCLAPF